MSDEAALQEHIRRFLRDHGIQGKDQLLALIQCVAAIPWGEARTAEEVLQKHKGTCSGKHLLLQECFDVLGVAYRPVVCTFRWERQNINFPPQLRDLLKDQSWEHGHNFIQLKGKGDSWIDVDVTWDLPLKRYGFRTFPKNWDGVTSFIGVDPVERRWDGVDIVAMKEQLIDELSSEQCTARSAFLAAFIVWINALR